MFPLRILTILTGIALIAACSRASNPPTANTQTAAATATMQSDAHAMTDTQPAKIDPCKLLTQTEASALIGAKTSPGQHTKLFGCTFRTASGDEVDVVVMMGVDMIAAEVPGSGMPLNGIGDKADWSAGGGGIYWLTIVKDGNSAQVGPFPKNMKKPTPLILKTAKAIARRM